MKKRTKLVWKQKKSSIWLWGKQRKTKKRIKNERVKKCVYLDVLIEEKGKELDARMAKGKKKLESLKYQMKSTYGSRKSKLRIFKTVILKGIFGLKNTEESWEKRTNLEFTMFSKSQRIRSKEIVKYKKKRQTKKEMVQQRAGRSKEYGN